MKSSDLTSKTTATKLCTLALLLKERAEMRVEKFKESHVADKILKKLNTIKSESLTYPHHLEASKPFGIEESFNDFFTKVDKMKISSNDIGFDKSQLLAITLDKLVDEGIIYFDSEFVFDKDSDIDVYAVSKALNEKFGKEVSYGTSNFLENRTKLQVCGSERVLESLSNDFGISPSTCDIEYLYVDLPTKKIDPELDWDFANSDLWNSEKCMSIQALICKQYLEENSEPAKASDKWIASQLSKANTQEKELTLEKSM
ncbi:hypothetical protein [Vibrio parahaemolyticus]|uniref:hypothetical protein n=1 Tax=Vibrio parahaemolyticus TaxID=670 RepID=UPI003D7D2DE0